MSPIVNHLFIFSCFRPTTKKVCGYILDPRKILGEDLLYRKSLVVEPRTARLSVSSIPPPLPLQSLPKEGPSLSRGQSLAAKP